MSSQPCSTEDSKPLGPSQPCSTETGSYHGAMPSRTKKVNEQRQEAREAAVVASTVRTIIVP